jgi:hypothetical protein
MNRRINANGTCSGISGSRHGDMIAALYVPANRGTEQRRDGKLRERS